MFVYVNDRFSSSLFFDEFIDIFLGVKDADSSKLGNADTGTQPLSPP